MIRLIKIILAALSVLFAINAVAAEPNEGEQLRAIKQMLSALKIGELYVDIAKKKLLEATQERPETAKDLEWLSAQITAPEAAERLAPAYAKYLTRAQADELRIFFTVPPGSKYWPGFLEQVATGKPSFPAALNWQERQSLDAFMSRSSGWRILNQLHNTSFPELGPALRRWIEEIVERRNAVLARQLADTLERGQGPGSSGKDTPPAAGGQGLVPEFFAIVRDLGERNAAIVGRLVRRANEFELNTVLAPANLLSRDGIENGRRKLELYEAELSKSQREQNQLYDEFSQRLRTLPGPASSRDPFVQKTEQGIAIAYERSLRAEENQRRLLSIMRQILSFAEERLGRINLQDNRLIFADINDLRLYESLRQQLEAEAKVEMEIAQEQRAARERSIKALRESGATPNQPGSVETQAKPAQPQTAPKSAGDFWLTNPKSSNTEPSSPCSSTPLPKNLGYIEALKMAIERCFIAPPYLAETAKCELEIQQSPTGKVESTKVGECVGHPLLGDFVVRAALKASPLPLPSNPKAFMPVVRLVFNLGSRSGNSLNLRPEAGEKGTEQLQRQVKELEAQQQRLLAASGRERPSAKAADRLDLAETVRAMAGRGH